jgi:hypothetical protein
MMIQSLLAALALTGAAQDIRPLLRAQHFYWTLKRADTEIKYVGDIKQRRLTYSIYLYSGINRESLHGINRLIVISNHSTYLGTYDSSLTYRCKTKGQSIICDNDSGYGRIVKFTKSGPPLLTNIDGALVTFDFAPRVQRRRRYIQRSMADHLP